MGLSPETVMVSSRPPTFSSAFNVPTKSPCNSNPSRLTGLKPVSVNVTVYVPGLRSRMRYCPVPSVIDDRTFSISTELDASTVTPGRTAPDTSLTVPVIEDWARANVGNKTVNARRIHVLVSRCRESLPIDRLLRTVTGDRRVKGTVDLTENTRQSYVRSESSQVFLYVVSTGILTPSEIW